MDWFSKIPDLVQKALSQGLTPDEALWIATADEPSLAALFAGAEALRRRRFSNRVHLCSIVNAGGGRCGEDCAFCAQSAHHNATIDVNEFLENRTILAAAQSAESFSASRFSIVTSGKGAGGRNFENAVLAIVGIESIRGLSACASLGVIPFEKLVRLRQAGLSRYHHNLETARSHYQAICTTRKYDENVETIQSAKKAGLSVCCGGIFGMGETAEQRVELAFELRNLEADSIPINFLHPIAGTPLESQPRLAPLECLRIIALFRYVLPDAQIVICGGRELNLGALQPLVFYAGASGLMIGNYLTTQGRPPAMDLKMISELGLVPASD